MKNYLYTKFSIETNRARKKMKRIFFFFEEEEKLKAFFFRNKNGKNLLVNEQYFKKKIKSLYDLFSFKKR